MILISSLNVIGNDIYIGRRNQNRIVTNRVLQSVLSVYQQYNLLTDLRDTLVKYLEVLA